MSDRDSCAQGVEPAQTEKCVAVSKTGGVESSKSFDLDLELQNFGFPLLVSALL